MNKYVIGFTILTLTFVALRILVRIIDDLKLKQEFLDILKSKKPFPIEWLPSRKYQVRKKIGENIILLARMSESDDIRIGRDFPIIVPASIFPKIEVSLNSYVIWYDESEREICFRQGSKTKTASSEGSPDEQRKAQKMRRIIRKNGW